MFRFSHSLSTQPIQSFASRIVKVRNNRAFASLREPTRILFCGKEFSGSTNAVQELLGNRSDVVVESCKISQIKERIKEATIAVPLMGRLDHETIALGSKDNGKLEFIMQWGVGLEGVDIEAASSHGILVANCQAPKPEKGSPPTVQSISTTEIALYLILSSLRQAPCMDHASWGSPRGELLHGKHVLVVGYGGIGASLVPILQGLGAKVSVMRSRQWGSEHPPGKVFFKFDMHQHKSSSQALGDAVTQCLTSEHSLDMVVMACPLNANTLGMFDNSVINSLLGASKPIHLVNVGRGGLTCRDAVQAGLESGTLKGFATDVWWTEPPSPEDPLLRQGKCQGNARLLNLTLTPHVGGCTQEGAAIMDQGVVENIERYLDGLPVKNPKNEEEVRHIRSSAKKPYRGGFGMFSGKGGVSRTAAGSPRGYTTLAQSSQQRANDHGVANSNILQSTKSRNHSVNCGSAPSITAPVHHKRGNPGALLEKLRAKFEPAQISVAQPVLDAHGKDESYHEPVAPDVVFYPRGTEDVQRAVEICAELDSPIINFGQGTSLEGMVAALAGGLCIDYRDMNSVLQVNAEDMDCVVQPGCTRLQLNHALKEHGMFFPIDPGADASIGGMVSTRASGTNAVRYGTMKQNVLGLTAVNAKGEAFHTGSRARKSSAGYDLTSLLVGSEGTLACLTEINLKLFGLPESVSAATCSFEPSPLGLKAAVDTVVTSLQLGVPIARAELLDTKTMQAVNQYSKLGLAESPTLFLEFHGTQKGVEEQCVTVQQVATDLGGREFQYAHHEEERNNLWKARHMAYYASMALRPGSKGWPTDVCVPLSSLADCIAGTAEDVDKFGVQAPIFGHVGDGNFHVILLLHPDLDGEEDLANLLKLNDAIVSRALSHQGTCTGEHGLGYGKTKWMVQEHGQVAVNAMCSIKRAFDPQNLLNPGKIIPDEATTFY